MALPRNSKILICSKLSELIWVVLQAIPGERNFRTQVDNSSAVLVTASSKEVAEACLMRNGADRPVCPRHHRAAPSRCLQLNLLQSIGAGACS